MILIYEEEYIFPRAGKGYINGLVSTTDNEVRFNVNFENDDHFDKIGEGDKNIDVARARLEGYFARMVVEDFARRSYYGSNLSDLCIETFCVGKKPRPTQEELLKELGLTNTSENKSGEVN